MSIPSAQLWCVFIIQYRATAHNKRKAGVDSWVKKSFSSQAVISFYKCFRRRELRKAPRYKFINFLWNKFFQTLIFSIPSVNLSFVLYSLRIFFSSISIFFLFQIPHPSSLQNLRGLSWDLLFLEWSDCHGTIFLLF